MNFKVGNILELPGVYNSPIRVIVTSVDRFQVTYQWLVGNRVGYFNYKSPLNKAAKIIEVTK